MAAPAGWSEGQLRTLARSNYYQHDGQELRMNSVKVADIMPFGLANVDADFGAGAGQGAGAGASQQPIDFDFPAPRIGASVGGIVAELRGERANKRPRLGGEPVLGEGFEGLDVEDILGGAVDFEFDGVEESKGEDLSFLDEDLPVEFTAQELDPSLLVIGGRQINYANVRRMKTRAFGFRRRLFFYEQLRRMKDEMRNNMGIYGSYQISATFSAKKSNADYAQGVAFDFGTTNVDGESRRVPFDNTKWDYDIHSRRVGFASPDFSSVEGNVVQLNYAEEIDGVIEALIRSFEDNLPKESDSGGDEGYKDTTKHLMNLFLFKFLRPRGGGLYDITGETKEKYAFSNRSVFNPMRRSTNMCFWECLVYFLYKSDEGGYKLDVYAHEEMLENMFTQLSRIKGSKLQKMRNLCQIYGPKLADLYSAHSGKDVSELTPLPFDEVDKVLKFYRFEKDVVILDTEGEAIYGVIDNVECRRIEAGEMTLMWLENHYMLVISYTGSLVVKKCRRCDKRFARDSNLTRHLESKTCMTCVCRGEKNPFETEEEWKEHMATRENTCPQYRLMSQEGSTTSLLDEEGKKLRFLNDPRNDSYRKKKDALEELEKDYSSFRTYEEAVFFDLESVVPMNKAGTKNADHEHQVPYACGWITRGEALEGGEVRLAYGEDCIGEFVDWMDKEYEKYAIDEENVWFKRASEGVLIDPKPKKNRGFTNYSMRVQQSWDKYVKGAQTPVCLYCDGILDKSHGYTVDISGNYSFSHCALRIYAKNTAASNMKGNFNNNAPRISVYAHNGGKYDWIFLHRYLMEKGKLDDLETVRNSSKYFQLSYKDIFVMKDSIYFMMGSLDKLGRDFNVETLKGIFPYRLLSSLDRIDMVIEGESEIREKIPHEYFQISEKIKGPMGAVIKRDMNEEEYVEFFSERGWRYDVKEETNMYLRDDVKCLFQVMEKFKGGWDDMPNGPKLFEYCTIGQMCHTYFLKHYLKKETYPCLDVCEDAYIRRALYGGRTEVFRRVAPEGGKIHYVDVNSLYPYVMESRDLPCGDPLWHFRAGDTSSFEFATSTFPVRTKICDEEFFEDLRVKLNEQSFDVYGFVEVDVLCNIRCRYPVLPERRSTDGGKTHKNMFTNMEKKRMVYYTEELKRAVRRGYIVTKVWSYSEWSRGRAYGELIRVLKEQKLYGEGKNLDGERIPGLEKNPSLRAAAKVAQNSLFGKTIQFIDSGVQLVHTREKLYKSINAAHSKVSIKPVFRSSVSDVVEVTSKFVVPKVQKRSCAALGTAILAEARLVLYDYFDEVEKIGGEILYCDTDSIVFSGDSALPEECMHDCHYGKMKVEIDPETIERGGFVGMSPKCYAFKLTDGTPYVKCKGVNLSQNLDMVPAERDAMDDLIHEMENEEYLESLGLKKDEEVMTRGLNYEKMRGLILGDIDVVVTNQLQFLKTTARHVSAYENVKMLRSHFDKRFLGDEGVTFPWNDFNMNMEEILKNMDNRALSDYLNGAIPDEIVYLRKLYSENDFFRKVFSDWLNSDSTNVLEYEYLTSSGMF